MIFPTVFIVLTLGSTVYNDTFNAASVLYNQANYAKAAETYEQLVAEGIAHPAVFYNLGNAYYRDRRLGLAIANYERALLRDPELDAARQNLAHCVEQTKQRLEKPQPPKWERALFFWHADWSPDGTRILALTSWIGLWTILAVRYWRPIRYLRRGAAVLAVLSIAWGASAWIKAHPVELAVAVVEQAPVRYGTSEKETVRFNLYEGDRVVIDRREGDWVRVTVANGDRGWARSDELLSTIPPYAPPPPSAKEAQDSGSSG